MGNGAGMTGPDCRGAGQGKKDAAEGGIQERNEIYGTQFMDSGNRYDCSADKY